MTTSKHDFVTALALLSTKGVGPAKTNKILEEINMDQELEKILSPSQKKEFQLNRERFDCLENGNNLAFITSNSDDYPLKLKTWNNHKVPPVLSLMGNADLLKEISIGFCGSRKASEKGIGVANDCVEQIVKQKNWVIVSGYAAGIDLTTHRKALEVGGKTILVLAEGIEYFKIKKALEDVWDWNRVLVLSQFLPDAGWTVGRAMERNRTIIGLSAAMILIEAGETGGSMAAGKETLMLKRPLFAPVYEGMPESAIGNRILIDKGALSFKKSKTTNKAILLDFFNTIETQPKCSFHESAPAQPGLF